MSIRALTAKARVLSLVGICFILAGGAFVVFQTRAQHALSLQDPSSNACGFRFPAWVCRDCWFIQCSGTAWMRCTSIGRNAAFPERTC